MKEQVLTIFESLLMLTGFSRCELCEEYAEEPKLRTAQNVMINALLKIVPLSEVKHITSYKSRLIHEIYRYSLSSKEIILFNKVWDLYIMLMHQQFVTNNNQSGKAEEYLIGLNYNFFPAQVFAGTY
ncbi:MAG: hypothetical protein LH629_16385 [Ignavibacteria bacterium]|nr:hypothetical protein [Ignavibacteria bacterium]